MLHANRPLPWISSWNTSEKMAQKPGGGKNVDVAFCLRCCMQALIRGAMLQSMGIGYPAGSAGPMDAPSGKGGIVYLLFRRLPSRLGTRPDS